MSVQKRRRLILWSRDEVSCCNCPDFNSVHAHCPCDSCCGKAVSRATEYRHWVATRDYLRLTEQDAEVAQQDEGRQEIEQDAEQDAEQDVERSVQHGSVQQQNEQGVVPAAAEELPLEMDEELERNIEQREDQEEEGARDQHPEELQDQARELDQDGMHESV